MPRAGCHLILLDNQLMGLVMNEYSFIFFNSGISLLGGHYEK
jgi:hypothetical protein